MSLMSVDSPSPSHTTMHSEISLNLKRARSSSLVDAYDRPVKRIVSESTPIPSPSNAPSTPVQISAATRARLMLERGNSDDWVTKTGGLRLDSPSAQFSPSWPFAQPQESAGQAQQDGWNISYDHEPMQTDFPDPTLRDYRNAHYPSEFKPNHPPPPSPSTSCRPHLLPPSDPGPQSPEDTPMHSAPPSPSRRIAADAEVQRLAWAASPHRQRVTLGPRADCEKCRAGVKDHWMHYD